MANFQRYARTSVKQLMFRLWTWGLGDEKGLCRVRTLSGPAKGLTFELDLLAGYATRYLLGNYEAEVVNRLARFVQPGWTVWDVGTYIGYYTCLFARLVEQRGRVVAVEADPRNLVRTRRHAALNGFSNVTFVSAAIGQPDAEAELRLNEGSNSHLAGTWIGAAEQDYKSSENYDETMIVKCKSLDQLLDEKLAPAPDLIKVDIDGAELWAFEHLEALARTVRPVLLVELHNPDCDAAAWRFALRSNYKIEQFETGKALDSLESIQGNILLTPRA